MKQTESNYAVTQGRQNGSRKAEKRGKKQAMRSILWIYVTAFIAVMLCVLWVFQLFFLDDFYRAIKKKEIKEAYEEVSIVLRQGDTVDTDAAMKQIAEQHGACVSVYRMWDDKSAATVVNIHVLPHCVTHSTDGRNKFIIYDAVKQHGGSYLQYFTYDPGNEVFSELPESKAGGDEELSMICAGVFSLDGESELLIVLNSVISPVSATVGTLYVQLAVFSVLFIVMGTLFAFLVSRRLTRPIEKLTDSAKLFGEGKLNSTFSATGYREIEELSDTLDYAASELEKNEKLRRELLANVSHDLRTPLTMIIGYGEMMRDIHGENTPENAANIVEEAERLNRLVGELTELSRLQTGTAQIEKKRYSLTEQTEAMVHRTGEMLQNDGFVLTFESNGSDAVINCDETRVGQVLYNLISNAVAHTGEDKTVRVKQTVHGGFVTISVSDSGEGIPAEMLSQIWERYYKINSAHRRGKGTGLGLSIVKAIMEQLGGHYGVQSKVGKGSTFWFALPLDTN